MFHNQNEIKNLLITAVNLATGDREIIVSADNGHALRAMLRLLRPLSTHSMYSIENTVTGAYMPISTH